ncbi:hypothetical protein JVX91_27975 [Pseudomonas sp. PDNC002]|uniref:hypothetical protein n=1 Tax=Pseudomonas sp. PDNC002 TaxID=2811422 RepID=UPI001962C04F|nr:hypothetical protein [Pseudomonas sp. PDNC002]QRY79357.1 hypothetical protein JVX91_27975 [Pseudomonas sp. PDNC002]
MFNRQNMMLAVHSASFNDEAASELIRELSRYAPNSQIAYRALDIIQHMEHDAKALEDVYQALEQGNCLIPEVKANRD